MGRSNPRLWLPIAASAARFGHQGRFDEILIERNAKPRTVEHLNRAVNRLNLFERQFVPQRQVLDAVLKQKSVATRRQPMQAGGNRERARVTVVAQAGPDLLNAIFDVRRVREAAPREIN